MPILAGQNHIPKPKKPHMLGEEALTSYDFFVT
jgi:hypothetical protein